MVHSHTHHGHAMDELFMATGADMPGESGEISCAGGCGYNTHFTICGTVEAPRVVFMRPRRL